MMRGRGVKKRSSRAKHKDSLGTIGYLAVKANVKVSQNA